MNTTDLLMFFAIFFQLPLGLTSAFPISLFSAVARSLSPNNWASQAPIARRDDSHLCFGPTDVSYEYGNQTHQDGILADCAKLSEMFKNITDEQGNITESCGNPPPPSKVRGDFQILGSEGNCSLWSKCSGTDTRNEVTFGYGDITDIIQLATDGLGTASFPKNSSIVSVHASTECETLQTDWIVSFGGSGAGIGSQGGGPTGKLRQITSNFSPV